MRAAGHDIGGISEMTGVVVDQMRESVNVARNAGLEKETGLGATIGQGAPDRSVLSPDDAFMLQGDALVEALADVQDMIFNPAFADADQPLRLEVFGQLEDLANIEAARRGVAEDNDRERGQRLLFDSMLEEALVAVDPDSDTGDSRTVETAQSARQFAGSEVLADMPEKPQSDESAAPPVREFTAEELNLPEGVAAPPPRELTPEQLAQRDAAWAETLSALGISEVDGVDINKVAESAEEWNVFNRAQEDSAARLAKVSEFLDERYPDKPWEQWTDKGYDLGRLSPDELTDLTAKIWSMDVEFEGGTQKVRRADGTERDVRMTVTPRTGGSIFIRTDEYDPDKPYEPEVDYDPDGTMSVVSYGHFERRFYDVETGELLAVSELVRMTVRST